MCTNPNPTASPTQKLSLFVDDADGWTVVSGGGGELTEGDSVERTVGVDVGLPEGDGDKSETSGVETGELAGLSGLIEEAGDGVGEEAGDDVEDAASVTTSSFIPWAQCPGVPQMKYLLPGEERVKVVAPLVSVWSALVVWQES